MRELDTIGIKYDQTTISQALIACMFHDTGLIKDSSENHGFQSRLYCEQFFSTNPVLSIENKEIVLSAVELHDDKSLKDFNDSNLNSFQDIHSLVSAADDLDAFGLIGVFRYLEIYLIRGIPLRELPAKVMVNLQNRFINFEKGFSVMSQFVESNRVKYLVAYNFFSGLETQINNSFSTSNDYLSIANLLSDCLINKRLDIYQTISFALEMNRGVFFQSFFENLRNELNLIGNRN